MRFTRHGSINTFLDRLLLNWNFYSVVLLGAEGKRCQVVDSMTQFYYGEIRPPCQIGIHLFKLSIKELVIIIIEVVKVTPIASL